jgi:hypothetical protein
MLNWLAREAERPQILRRGQIIVGNHATPTLPCNPALSRQSRNNEHSHSIAMRDAPTNQLHLANIQSPCIKGG